jgi:hypothetical protein
MLTVKKTLERLAVGNSWIGQRPERIRGLRNLLTDAELIGGAQGLDFVDTLIGRVTFLTSDDFDNLIYEMAEYIAQTFALESTVICAATADHEKDSGQRVLYDLCSALGLFGHTKIRTVNRYDHVYGKAGVDITDVVLIDEFIGTGRSFLGRVTTMRKQFISGKKSVPKFHGLAVAGMSEGLRGIAHGFESLGVCTSLLKGIQDMSPPNQMADEYALMSLFEDHLCSSIDGKEIPRLGDGACEALYSRSIGNCPNSVFPIFWWSRDSIGRIRNPIFPRVL